MTKNVSQPPREHYIVPARQLSGTREEVLAQIDELVLGLTGLRQLVSLHGPTPAEVPRRKLHLVKGFLRVLFAVAIALWASPAQGQTGASGSTPPAAQEPERAQTQKAADNPWAGLVFGATIETFYQYNWNRPPDRVLLLRAYDTRSNTFAIQQVALIIDAVPDVEAGRHFGGRVDLQFGMATDTVQGNPANEPRPEVYRHLWQVYGTYVLPVGPDGLQIDAGKYASMLGYETNYAKDNQAFSRPYLFNFLPFYARYQLTTSAAVGLRYERLDDEGLFGGIDQVVQETTLTAE
jgi:hypothetical protein